MDLDKIKRQLRGILAKAEDGSGATEAEAEAAMEFARRMMLRHQLTKADLKGEEERTPSEIAADTEYDTVDAFTAGGNLSTWECFLSNAVENLVGTVQSYHGGKAGRRSATGNLEFDSKGQPKVVSRLVFYGPAEDCRDASELFMEWSMTISALARLKHGGCFRGPGRSYAEGFASALYEKTKKIKRRELAQISAAKGGLIDGEWDDQANLEQLQQEMAEAEAAGCTALVVVKANELMLAKKQRGTDWLREEKGVHLQSSGSRSVGRHHGDAFNAGRAAGRNADFNRNVTKKLS